MNTHLPLDSLPRGTRILFPESSDIRILMATIELHMAGIIVPVLLGNRGVIGEIFRDSQYFSEAGSRVLDQIEIISLDETPQREMAITYSEKKGIPLDQAMKLFPLDLAQAVTLLGSGTFAGVVAGSIATTADVIRTGYYGLGLVPGRRISGEFLMIPPESSKQGDISLIGDSAVTPDPSVDELVEIARSLVETHEMFRRGVRPRVAFLSYSTHASGAGESVDKVRSAVERFRAKYPDIEVDGPLQFDAAIDRDIYLSKTYGKGSLTDVANILVFPDLNSGNIVYKAMERFGGYAAIGPILTGFATPGWSDLSRGTSIETIIDMAYVTAIRSS